MEAEPTGAELVKFGTKQQTQTMSTYLDKFKILGHSFDLTDEAESNKLVSALTGKAESIGDTMDEKLPIEHVLIHNREKTDKATGEVSLLQRIVFVTNDGRLLQSFSPVVFEALNAVFMTKTGYPPWRPALLVKFNKEKASGQGHFHTMIVVGRQQTVPGESILEAPIVDEEETDHRRTRKQRGN